MHAAAFRVAARRHGEDDRVLLTATMQHNKTAEGERGTDLGAQITLARRKTEELAPRLRRDRYKKSR